MVGSQTRWRTRGFTKASTFLQILSATLPAIKQALLIYIAYHSLAARIISPCPPAGLWLLLGDRWLEYRYFSIASRATTESVPDLEVMQAGRTNLHAIESETSYYCENARVGWWLKQDGRMQNSYAAPDPGAARNES